MTTTHYSRELKPPKTKREGLCNFVQMIINQLERGEHGEALYTAVDLLNDIKSESFDPYGLNAAKGATSALVRLEQELRAKHQAELEDAIAKAYQNGITDAKRHIAITLGLA